MIRSLKLGLVFVVLLVVQTRVLNGFTFAGLRPAVMLLVPVAAAMDGDSVRAAGAGFASGLVLDLFLETPLGTCALAFTMLGYAVAAVERGVIRADVWLQPAVAGVASAIGVILIAGVAAVFGEPEYARPGVLAAAAFAGLVNLVLSVPVTRLVRWALGAVSGSLAERSYA